MAPPDDGILYPEGCIHNESELPICDWVHDGHPDKGERRPCIVWSGQTGEEAASL